MDSTGPDLTGNARRIIECAVAARARAVQVLVTPELAFKATWPAVLLLLPDFYRACGRALDDLLKR